MKTIIAYLLLLGVLLSCANQTELNQLRNERDDLARQLNINEKVIQSLRDSISMLSFPADQRIAKINNLISSGNYVSAKQEISQLNSLFPESKEAKTTSALLERIDRLVAQKKMEEERIKALGFKALIASSIVTIDYNKVEITNISVGNTFSFDSYGSHYFYRTADKGSKYISAAMKITTDEKNPKLPQLAVYQINGDTMAFEGVFSTEFARWDDYGSYLGNYHDNGNDFAKTSSVRFKIGKEVPDELIKGPYALVLKKENVLTRQYEQFENPPISYIGYVDYPSTLKLDDFTGDKNSFVVIKISNL